MYNINGVRLYKL